jgi:hypothetical protein
MKKSFVITAISAFFGFSIPSQAASPFDSVLVERVVEGMKTPIFYSSCATTEGSAILFFDSQNSTGKMLEMRQGIVVNTLSVRLTGPELEFNLEQTQGGAYTFAIMENRTRELFEGDFKVLISKKAPSGRNYTNGFCVDQPPI